MHFTNRCLAVFEMNEDKINIDLKIDNIRFPMLINESQKELYLNAVNLINNKLELYRARFKNHSTNELYCMVLLNFAINVLNAQNQENVQPVLGRLQELNKDLDNLLNKKTIIQ